MKLFSALKPRLNNTSAAKRCKARTITRCLLVIIFLEETALKYAGSGSSPQERSLRMLALNLSPHLRGCYWFLLLIKCGNSDFVIFVYIFRSIWTECPEKAACCAARVVLKPSWVAVRTYWREATDQWADMNLVAATGAYTLVREDC